MRTDRTLDLQETPAERQGLSEGHLEKDTQQAAGRSRTVIIETFFCLWHRTASLEMSFGCFLLKKTTIKP